MKLLVSVLLLLAVAVAHAGNVKFTSCYSGSKGTVSSIDANPWPVKKGAALSLTVSGSLSEQVTAATYSLTVKFMGVQIFSQGGDMCTLDPKFPCPFPAGPLTLSTSFTVPGIAPSGSYEILLNATEQNDYDLFCLDIPVQITSDAKENPASDDDDSSSVDLSKKPAIDLDMINYVNSKRTTWRAGVNLRFANQTMALVKGLCGARKEINPLPVKIIDEPASIPTSFDARTAWPQCQYIGHIRDQGACGSCWAFGGVEAMTDRVCIATNGSSQPYLAAEDILSCCGWSCGEGCEGGYPSGAWSYFESYGVVTGGDWNTNQGCYPYQVEACEHHVSGSRPPCGEIQNTPACTETCLSGYSKTWQQDKTFGATAYSVPQSVSAIQTEIMTYGPVEAAFTVYEDFVSYKSGVYIHTSGSVLGGHAVKIFGWGVDSSTPYWIVANSWNTDWGDNGFFNILRGVDECGIEDSIVAGRVKS